MRNGASTRPASRSAATQLAPTWLSPPRWRCATPGRKLLSFQLLIYGVYSTDSESPSWQRFGQGAGLSQTQMRWIFETYLERPEQQSDWRVAPLLADLKGLPPAHLIVGSLDPLQDDSDKLLANSSKPGCRPT